MRSGLLRSMAACALGGVLVLISQALTWARQRVTVPTGGSRLVHAGGHVIEPGLRPIGIALLVLAVALLAGSGVMRRLAGFITALVGAGGMAVAASAPGDTPVALAQQAFGSGTVPHAAPNGWWVLAFVGATLGLTAGLATLFFGGRWETMGARYQPPAAHPDAEPAAETDAGAGRLADADATWQALDRGEDPTG